MEANMDDPTDTFRKQATAISKQATVISNKKIQKYSDINVLN